MPQQSPKSPLLSFVLILSLFVLVAFSPAFSAPQKDKDPAKTAAEAKPGQQAQEKRPAGTETNVEITVTAPRVEIPLKQNPAATTVVETPILRNAARTVSIDEVLKLVPGVKVDDQADDERVHISIRGEGILTERGTRGIEALVDGIPLNDPSGYIYDFYDLDWVNVRRIEVLRGPAAAFYGSGSEGGILNILTRNGGPDPVSGNVELTRGSFGLKKGYGEVGGTVGLMNYDVTGSMLSGDGYRQHAAFSDDNAHGKFTFTLSPRVKVTAIFNYTNYFDQNPEGLNLAWFSADPKVLRRLANPDSYNYNEYYKTQRATGGLTSTIGLARNLDLAVTAYYRHTRFTEAVPDAVDHRGIDNPGFNLQINHKAGEGWLKNYLSAGVDASWQSFDEIKHPNIGNAVEGPDLLADQTISQTGAGVFALDRVELGPQWGLSASVRYDRVTDKLADHLQAGGIDLSSNVAYHRATGRLGVTWNPLSDFGLYASWGTGFLPPGTEELIENPYSFGGFNTHLVAATSTGEEVGARGSITRAFTYDLALFHLNTKNDFGRYRMEDRPLETFYGNVGSTRRYGIEASLGWFPIDPLALRVAYTYSHYKYTSVATLAGETFNGTWLPNIPQHQLYADAEYHITPHLTVGAALEYLSSWYIDSTNRVYQFDPVDFPGVYYGKTDPYALVHVRVGYKFQFQGIPMELFLSGHNIFNVLYYGFTEPDPDGNSYQPAPTAEWSLTVRLGFN